MPVDGGRGENSTRASDPREALEIRLRMMLDEDDAVSAVQVMLAAGWRPPPAAVPDVTALAQTLREETDDLIEATHVGEPWQVSSAQKAWDDALAALIAEVERMEQEARVYDTALAVLDASTDKVEDADGFITEYRWRTGAFHKILGFRPKILALAGEFNKAERERDALLAELERLRQENVRLRLAIDDAVANTIVGETEVVLLGLRTALERAGVEP